MTLRPVPRLGELPAIDDVVGQIDGVGVVVTKEVEEKVGSARARSEMDIGNPDGTVPLCLGVTDDARCVHCHQVSLPDAVCAPWVVIV